MAATMEAISVQTPIFHLYYVEFGATPDSRSKCLQTYRIHHQVKYWRLNANTSMVAAILFSSHPYIGRHYRASLILILLATLI